MCPAGLGAIEVVGLAADSRKVEPGFVFFAVPGNKVDGVGFIAQAIDNGAVAVIAERQPVEPLPGIAFIIVDDVRRTLACAAALFYGVQPQTIVAITGTSGKTSIAAFCRQIWQTLGHDAASVGTIGVVTSRGSIYGALTTPDPIVLHKTLADLAAQGTTHLALEASSHGIEQKRLDGVRMRAAAFTNLSRDHLDYHGTLDAYLTAKLRLFEELVPDDATAVINADSDVADRVIAACKARDLAILDVGRSAARLRLVAARPEGLSVRLELEFEGRKLTGHLPLAGDFQISNALVAAGLCIAAGSPAEAVVAALGRLEGAPGRLQLVGQCRFEGQDEAAVFVDYAHKPDALDKVLTALRPLAKHGLIVVFGCGGDRDQGKRPIMGEIAARLADKVIVTDDNPRSEPAADIRRAILSGAKGPATVTEIGDRGAAIAAGVAGLEAGDILVIAGKGHETGQTVGDHVLPFSDLDVARLALQNRVP